jgi:hypothetical protein
MDNKNKIKFTKDPGDISWRCHGMSWLVTCVVKSVEKSFIAQTQLSETKAATSLIVLGPEEEEPSSTKS